MAKRKAEYKGHIPVYGPSKDKGPDFGEVLGAIAIGVFVLFLLASCGG